MSARSSSRKAPAAPVQTRTRRAPKAAAAPPPQPPNHVALGGLVRDLRKRMGVTLSELAGATHRSVGFISQIERGLSQPTVLDMTLIAERLAVPGSYFYLGDPPARSWMTRPAERRTMRYADGFVDHLVSPSLSGRLCVLESELAPGADSGDRDIVEHQEQAVFVLEGEITIWFGGEECVLRPGDACQLPGGSATRYANRGKRPARALWLYC